MSLSIHDYGVLVYWIVYVALTLLPRLLYRQFASFDLQTVIEHHPRFFRLIDMWPRLTSGMTVLLLILVFAMWMSPTYERAITMHVVGVGYGALLLLDAGLAWITRIRPISGLRQRYIVNIERSWRPLLQLGLACAYVVIPVIALLTS